MVQNSALSCAMISPNQFFALATLDWDLIAGEKNAPDLSREHEA